VQKLKSRKSLTINDLGGPAPRKHLMVNDLELSSLNRKKKLVINPESVIMVVMKAIALINAKGDSQSPNQITS